MTRWILAVLAAGCASERVTQIVAVIDTDAEVPGEIDTMVIRVLDEQAELVAQLPFVLGDGPGQAKLPADFGVAPREGRDPEQTVTVAVEASRSSARLFTTEVETGFAEGKMLRLDVLLARRCLTAPCGDEPCGAERCGKLELDPSALPEFRP